MPFDAPNMHHTREVPHMPNRLSPPYLAWSSSNFDTIVDIASSQPMRTQPGSSESFGFVRFIG